MYHISSTLHWPCLCPANVISQEGCPHRVFALLHPPTFTPSLQVMLVNVREGSVLIAGGGLRTVISFLQGFGHNK